MRAGSTKYPRPIEHVSTRQELPTLFLGYRDRRLIGVDRTLVDERSHHRIRIERVTYADLPVSLDQTL